MPGPYLLGVDLGTTECKAALVSARGVLQGIGRAPCSLSHLGAGRVEQDAHQWWSVVCEATAKALASADVAPGAVRGIAVSSQGISFVPTDTHGEPLSAAISWLDSRAAEQADAVLQVVSAAALFARTGKRASPVYMLPKLLWLRQHERQVYDTTARVLMAHDYVVHRLTGEAVTDHTLASGTAVYDVRQQRWDDNLLQAFAIPRDRLPAIAWSGSCAGRLGADAAEWLGLAKGTPVAVGGQDQKLAALAAGVGPARATVSLGTASAVSQVLGEPRLDDQMLTPLFSFCLPGLWDLEGVVGTAGAALAWFRDTVTAGMAYADIDMQAAASRPGASGVRFYPHLAGATSPHWREWARGSFTGLSLATSRADLARALIEGVAFQVRANLSRLAALAAEPCDIIVSGGGAGSRLWCHILADVLGKPVGVPASTELAVLGAAMAAAVAGGLHASLAEARAEMLGLVEWIEPDGRASAQYEAIYADYVCMEAALLADSQQRRP